MFMFPKIVLGNFFRIGDCHLFSCRLFFATYIERKAIVEANKEKFGAEYIILPNSVYGDWDSATFNYDYKKTDEQKNKHRIDALNNYKEQETNKFK